LQGPRLPSLFTANRHRLVAPALLVASAALLFLGLTLPLIDVEKFLWENEYSVATGVFGLWEDGEYVLAAVVFFFSVVFPIAKLSLLSWIWLGRVDPKQRDSTLRWLAALGKWSMLDVFIVAILVVAAKLGPMADVSARSGVFYFGAAIVTSMLATEQVIRLARGAR
jgi:paraquat-inducible protein A